MLATIKNLPPGIDGLDALGKVSKEDHDQVLEPRMNKARQEGRRFRLLYRFGPAFEGFTPSGAWEDLRLGLRFGSHLEGCAIVTDHAWLRGSSQVFGYFLPCPVRVFANSQRDVAAEWLRSLPLGSAVSHRLFRDEGVAVIEVKQAPHSFDFDAVVATIDSWLEEKHDLNGLVIHAHDFAGWENLAAFFRHLRFTNDRHKTLKRVVLAGGGEIRSLAHELSAHFVGAEVRTFEYDDLDAAVGWARGTEGALHRSESQGAATLGRPSH